MAHAKIRGLEGVQRSTWTRGCRGRGRYTHDYICTCFRLGTHTHTHGTLLLLGATEARASRLKDFSLPSTSPFPALSFSSPFPLPPSLGQGPAGPQGYSGSPGAPGRRGPPGQAGSCLVRLCWAICLRTSWNVNTSQPACDRGRIYMFIARTAMHVYCKDSYTWRIHIFIRGYTCLLQGQLTPLLPPPSRASWSSRQHWHTRSQRRTWNRWCARPGWASGPRYDTANRTRCSTCPARSW